MPKSAFLSGTIPLSEGSLGKLDYQSQKQILFEHPWLILESFLKTMERGKYSDVKGRCVILLFQSSLYPLLCHPTAIPHVCKSYLKVKAEELHLMFYLWKSCACTRAWKYKWTLIEIRKQKKVFPLLFLLLKCVG